MELTKNKTLKTPTGFNRSIECEQRDFHNYKKLQTQKTRNQGRPMKKLQDEWVK
jgi:hypothetical protein